MKMKEVGKHVDNLIYSGNCLNVTVNISEHFINVYKEYMSCIEDVRHLTHDISCLKTARKHLLAQEEIDRVINSMESDLRRVKLHLEEEYHETPN